jgi:hypothetical protein
MKYLAFLFLFFAINLNAQNFFWSYSGTAKVPPTVTTTAITSIAQTTAAGGGNVTSDGHLSVTARGVCWNTSTNPTLSNNYTSNGTGTGSFTSSLSSLTPDTYYYVRSYATNNVGTAYGNQVTFITLCNSIPQLNVVTPGNRPWASGTAIIGTMGTYSLTATEVGICYNTTGTPTIANSKKTFTQPVWGQIIYVTITGLTPGQAYYFRPYAINPCGTGYYGTTGYLDTAGN